MTSKVIAGVFILAIGLALFGFVTAQVSSAAAANTAQATLLNLIPVVYVLGLVAASVAAFLGKIPGMA